MSQNQPKTPGRGRQGHSPLTRAKNMTKAILLAAVMVMLESPSSPIRIVPAQTATTLQIAMSPGLYPNFDPSISDYVVVGNPGSPVQVSVNAPRNTKVSVDGQPFQKLAFTTNVNMTAGQSFSFVVNSPGSSATYYVRCLPSDFPTWTTERPSTPPAEYFVFAPNYPAGANRGSYVIIADNYGVPMWWHPSQSGLYDAKLLPDGNVGWIGSASALEYKLDGTFVHSFIPHDGSIDVHEFQLLSNGNYLLIVDVKRGPVDLSSFGGSATANVYDNVIEEFAPNGSLVWRWSAMDHLSLSETEPQWWSQYIVNSSPADPYHMNAVEENGTGFVVSLRHLGAVIRISKANGAILWKLGGISRPESLTFVGDPYGNFGGQHDARVLPDGTLTLHDNGTNQGRPPRAVRFRINPTAGTATWVEQIMDPDVPSSGCCGSARKQPNGAWVVDWGLNPFVTALTPGGERLFRITLQGPHYTYRGLPVQNNVLSRAALRAGMNAQYPR